MTYANVAQVEAGFRTLTADERTACEEMLEEAALLIDAYNDQASLDVKRIVSCRIIRRALGNGSASVPIGATQGSMTAGPYTQSWTMSGGSTGELYLGRTDKKLLGVGNQIGFSNPFREVRHHDSWHHSEPV